MTEFRFWVGRSGPKSHGVYVECLIGKQKKPILFKVTEPSSVPYRAPSACAKMAVCVECLIGKQKKPILFKVTVSLPSELTVRNKSSSSPPSSSLITICTWSCSHKSRERVLFIGTQFSEYQ